LFSRTNRKLK
jgi:hypothetical protein